MKEKDADPSESEGDKVSFNDKSVSNKKTFADVLKKLPKESIDTTTMYAKSKIAVIRFFTKLLLFLHMSTGRVRIKSNPQPVRTVIGFLMNEKI